MAISGLADNQMVTDTKASTAGFPLKSGQAHSTTGKIMTKDEANTKYSLSQTQQSSYAGNQLLPAGAWVSGAPVPYTTPSVIMVSQSGGATGGGNSGTLYNAPSGTVVRFKITLSVGSIAGSVKTVMQINGVTVYTTAVYSALNSSNIEYYNWTSNGGTTVINMATFTGSSNQVSTKIEVV